MTASESPKIKKVFKIGDPVRLGSATTGKVIAVVPEGVSPQRVMDRICDESGVYMRLTCDGSVKDHEAYIVQVSETLCRLPDLAHMALDTVSVFLAQTSDQRRRKAFRARVVKSDKHYEGSASQEGLLLQVTWNGADWKSLPLIPREIGAVVRALSKAKTAHGQRRKAKPMRPKSRPMSKSQAGRRGGK